MAIQPSLIKTWRGDRGVGAYRYTPGGYGSGDLEFAGIRRPVDIFVANAGVWRYAPTLRQVGRILIRQDCMAIRPYTLCYSVGQFYQTGLLPMEVADSVRGALPRQRASGA